MLSVAKIQEYMQDSIAYHFWQEVVANFISLNVAIRTGTPVGISTGISLKQALAGNTRELALHQERYWEIDMSWINSVKTSN